MFLFTPTNKATSVLIRTLFNCHVPTQLQREGVNNDLDFMP
jgi:hypothetical protein